MRLVRMSFACAAIVIAACSSFDAADEPSRPATAADASSPDATNGASSSGALDDAAVAFTCPPEAAFCDDFTRKDANDLKGAWTSLQTAPGDPPAKIENGAFHLFSGTVDAGGETARTYLLRSLPDCTSSKVTIDFDFMLEGPPRTANLSVITIETPGKTYYIALAFRGPNIELAVGASDTPQVLEGATGAPPFGAWTHATYAIDLSAGAVGAQIGSVSLGVKQTSVITNPQSCRFALGDDFIEPGGATSRWYDNVVANVTR